MGIIEGVVAYQGWSLRVLTSTCTTVHVYDKRNSSIIIIYVF